MPIQMISGVPQTSVPQHTNLKEEAKASLAEAGQGLEQVLGSEFSTANERDARDQYRDTRRDGSIISGNDSALGFLGRGIYGRHINREEAYHTVEAPVEQSIIQPEPLPEGVAGTPQHVDVRGV